MSVFFIDMTWIFYLLHLKEYKLSDIKTGSVLNSIFKARELMKRLELFWNRNDARRTEMEVLLNMI